MGRSNLRQKELLRQQVLSRVERKELKLKEAAKLMQVSYPQAKRLWKRYRKEGPQGLQHRGAGQRSNHAKPAGFRAGPPDRARAVRRRDPGVIAASNTSSFVSAMPRLASLRPAASQAPPSTPRPKPIVGKV